MFKTNALLIQIRDICIDFTKYATHLNFEAFQIQKNVPILSIIVFSIAHLTLAPFVISALFGF